MAVKLQVRRGTATEWANNNVVLAAGEFGFDTTNKLLKIGDGSLTFSALPDVRVAGVIPSGGTDGQALSKLGTGFAWKDYVYAPTNNPTAGATLVRNSGNTANIWVTGAGLGTITAVGVSSTALSVGNTNPVVGGAVTIGISKSGLNTELGNLGETYTATYANLASRIDIGKLNLNGNSADTGTININTSAVYPVDNSQVFTARTTNISTGRLTNGGAAPAGEGDQTYYSTTTAVVNIGDSTYYPLNHTTNIYGNLKLPQWTSGALITDANGLVGKQTVASNNVTGAIVARDSNGDFSARNITSAGTITATTSVTASSVFGTTASFTGTGTFNQVTATAVTATTVTATTVVATNFGTLANPATSVYASTVTATSVSVSGTVAATTLTGSHDAASLTGTLAVARIAAGTITGGTGGKIATNTITDTNISTGAAIADSKLAQIASTNKVANSATTATSANTISTIVARDGSGNFSAGTITAAFSGSGANLTSIPNSATTATSSNVTSAIVSRDNSGNFSAGTITATQLNGSGAGLTAKTVPLTSINSALNAPCFLTVAPNVAVSATTRNVILTITGSGSALLSLDALLSASPATDIGTTVTVVRTDTNFTTNGVKLVDTEFGADKAIVRPKNGGAATATIINAPLSGGGSWATLVYGVQSGNYYWFVMASS